MAMTQEKPKVDVKQLEALIKNAIQKVGAKKENDICRYIPVATGGYIHHFTMRKMKMEAPEQLAAMISKYIVNASAPSTVPPKQRAARGSRKRRDQYVFSKHELERLRHIALQVGDKDMARKLTPKEDLRTIKRKLLASIKHDRVEPELWHAFVDAIMHQQSLAVLSAGTPS